MLRQRKYAIFALLTLSICALALYIHRHRQGRTGYVDELIISFTGRLQKQSYYLLKGAQSIVDHYFWLVDVKQENDTLKEEVNLLRTKLAQAEEGRLENIRLRDALKFRERIEQPLISANVIAHDVSRSYFGIRVDRGKKSGVKSGMGVISTSGVVGRILRVTDDFSDVLTVVDPTSNIDAIVQRSRARGIISGQSKEGTCRFKYIGRLEDVSLDDVAVSSGFGNIFPKGLLVGYVTAVIPSSSGVLQSVTVRSSVDIYRLEEVFIVFPPDHAEQVS